MKKHVWICVYYDNSVVFTRDLNTRRESRMFLRQRRRNGWKTKNPIKVSLP